MEHKYVIRGFALHACVNGHDVNFESGGLCHLAEAHHDIICEVMGFLIFNIIFLNKDAQAFGGFLITAQLCVSQLYSSL